VHLENPSGKGGSRRQKFSEAEGKKEEEEKEEENTIPRMKVAVIGAGPSGLVTLKYLLEAHKYLGCEPVEARLFEYQPQVGGTFVARVYEDAEVSCVLGQYWS